MSEKFFFNYLTQSMQNDALEFSCGRWWIKPGFAGCNTRTNNSRGYKTQQLAEVDILFYQEK